MNARDDALAAEIAERLRDLPAVERVYRARRGAAGIVSSAVGLLAAVADDAGVAVRERGGVLEVEASLGVSAAHPAPATATEAIAAIRAAVPPGRLAAVRIRIASIG